MLSFSSRTADAQAAALARLLAGGWLQLFGGGMPADADAPVRDQPLLAEVRLADEAPAVRDGAFAFAAQSAVSPKQQGKPTWFRCVNANGQAVIQGTVGTADADLLIEREEILPGHELAVTAFSYRQPKGK